MSWVCMLKYLTNSELYSDKDLQEGSLRLNGNKGEDYKSKLDQEV